MGRKIEKEVNANDEVTIVTLSDLLRNGVAIAALATTIERLGIYCWDKYGRFGHVGGAGNKTALDLLAKQLAWEGDPLLDESGDPRSPRELSDDFNGGFGNYGWPENELPDFDAIYQEYEKTERVEVRRGIRKAPDRFVAALIRLLLEIAKRNGGLDVTRMPGTKKELHEVAKKIESDLECEYETFATYIKGLIAFKRGRSFGTPYKDLFPEYFK
jgi:hypothetical protein